MIKNYIDKIGIDQSLFDIYLKKINTKGFNIYKLEKDFYLTIILQEISQQIPELIFKGGTCLNKVYLDYYRLSEDLDFNIVFIGNRSQRKQLIQKIDEALSNIFKRLKLKIIDSYKRDENRFYNISTQYKSFIDKKQQNVLFDIKIIEKLELPPVLQKVNSIFINYMTGKFAFDDIKIMCMDFDEIVSEKLRASLTRKEPAIRDFFDVWYIKEIKGYDFKKIRGLLDNKLKEVDYKYSLYGSYDILFSQIEKILKPVLKQKFDFDLKYIYEYILSLKN